MSGVLESGKFEAELASAPPGGCGAGGRLAWRRTGEWARLISAVMPSVLVMISPGAASAQPACSSIADCWCIRNAS